MARITNPPRWLMIDYRSANAPQLDITGAQHRSQALHFPASNRASRR
jgi:hypothetical protein